MNSRKARVLVCGSRAILWRRSDGQVFWTAFETRQETRRFLWSILMAKEEPFSPKIRPPPRSLPITETRRLALQKRLSNTPLVRLLRALRKFFVARN